MASSSGTSSGSSGLIQNSGSEEDLQKLMDQRKRKRMVSNRESARRSRKRKEKYLDDLMNQVDQLRKENNDIITSMNVTSQHYVNVEAENSVLRAQVNELGHRLQSLSEIIGFLNANNGCLSSSSSNLEDSYGFGGGGDVFLINNGSWNNHHDVYANHNQLLMASPADMFNY